jgi:hypothetical protein
MILPDMAKSAATLMCLGADSIVMGPGGDLGPVDPQFQLGSRSLASAKVIVAAVDEAEERITRNPDTFPLFAGLLADVNMLMVDHSAVIPVHVASQLSLPAVAADPGSDSWALIWSLWTRYFTLGCFPAGQVAVYEGNRASNIIMP